VVGLATIAQSSHADIPPIALGTAPASFKSHLEPGASHAAFFANLTLRWLRLGGVHLDAAWKYHTLEHVGQGITAAIEQNVITRPRLFVSAKVLPDVLVQAAGHTNGSDAIRALLLQPLRLEYVDVLCVHLCFGPTPLERRC
jgi:diketogulonate reductase-like aldo/keto reductase